MIRRMARNAQRDRGAAAVEFALLLPLLLFIVFGLIDFGLALNAKITLTQAAREGARVDALGGTSSFVTSRTQTAATGLTGVSVSESYTCISGDGARGKNAIVVATYYYSFNTPVSAIAGLFGGSGYGSTLKLSATGVMPCET